MKFVAFVLTVLGGLNWLTIGMLQYDFVAGIFGTQANIFSRLIYSLVGISAIYTLFFAIINKGNVFAKNKNKNKKEIKN